MARHCPFGTNLYLFYFLKRLDNLPTACFPQILIPIFELHDRLILGSRLEDLELVFAFYLKLVRLYK